MKIDRVGKVDDVYSESVAAYQYRKRLAQVEKPKKEAVDTKDVGFEEKSYEVHRVKKAIKEETLDKINRELISCVRFEYDVHEDTKRIIIRVKEPDSEKVICEIPPEKLLEMAAFYKKYVSLKIDTRG
ncbi:MAG: flagellar protein FlaG [Clostridiaceae bacterium]|nr:flagellar protein FlaG [Clostridiaceae bacterium]